MTKQEKIQSLERYIDSIKYRLTSTITPKWEHSPESYKAFLERELKLTSLKVSGLKEGAK